MAAPKMTQQQKKHLALALGTILVLSGLVLITRRFSLISGGGLNGVMLSNVDKLVSRDMGSCATQKCLTIYVAPWCSICRASTGVIAALKAHLDKKGVEARIVVGRDTPANVEAYAREFGPDTYIDAEGRFPLRGGVPNFVISNAEGEILKVSPGLPQLFKPPFPPELLDELGKWMGAL